MIGSIYVCIALPPLNYASWQQEYFFVELSFLLESRENWASEDEISFNVFPVLNRVEIDYVDKVSKTCTTTGFEKGVPFSLVEKEDFCFEGE